ncbi:hypothetical protein Tco_0203080, partial [Tanacetum coccineum]
FFLGLQVHQSPHGIFISQSQYAKELLKKHGLDECVSIAHLWQQRDWMLIYKALLLIKRLIVPVKHLKEVKRIFRYLRQSYNMGLWYLKDSGFELIAYSDADHASCKDDCKSTSGGLQFLGGKLMSWSLERISKKRTKNLAKTTKPDTEWESVEKIKSRQSPSLKK